MNRCASIATALLAVGALLLPACGSKGYPLLTFDSLTGLPAGDEDLGWHPREWGATTCPLLLGERTRLEVPDGGPWALEVATGIPPGKRAAFRIAPAHGGDSLLFKIVDGGEDGRWVAWRIGLPGDGEYVLEVLPAGQWARRLGRAAPEGATFSLPRLVRAKPGKMGDLRPNLLLISADTLRADRLGCYGAKRPTSPAIDRLAAEGVLVERAYAASNWTLPSHYSMFTGLDPSAHGVNPDFTEVSVYLADRLIISGSGKEYTLAEALRDAGYRTRAFTENGWVSACFGFHQGFDAYDSDVEGNLGRTRERALPWLRENAEHGPWFLFVHSYEVHQPYHAPEPFRSRFVDPGHVGFAWPGAAVPIKDLNRFKVPTFPPTAGDVEAFRGLYDGGVAYMDTFVAKLRGALEEAKVERRTLVVFTSDHGEELFERGGFDHIKTLYEEVARVPLILWAPGCPDLALGTRVGGGPFSLTDLSNTLLGLLGIDPAQPVGLGRDLSTALTGGPAPSLPAGEAVFAESKGENSEAVRALWIAEGGCFYKYLRIDREKGREEALFELGSDPGEWRSLAAWRLNLLERMREEVRRREDAAEAVRKALEVGEATAIDEETLEKLRSLGYVK